VGSVKTLAREAKWKDRKAYNDAEAARRESEAPDGWGNTPPTSPIHEGWPGVPADANSGTWPLLSDIVPLHPNGWPDLSHSVQGSNNRNTTQTLEYAKDKYNVKIRKQRVSPKVPPTTYKGQRIK
jgi:hypothetical protein